MAWFRVSAYVTHSLEAICCWEGVPLQAAAVAEVYLLRIGIPWIVHELEVRRGEEGMEVGQ